MSAKDLTGQSAIVTGAGTGIGQGIALALAAAGVKVVLTGRRQEPLEQVAATILAQGGQAFVAPGDVSREEDVRQLIDTAVKTYGGLNIVVNNAAIGRSGYLHKMPVAVWDEVMNINLRGPYLMARYALPIMRDARQGHIINISSESGIEYYEGDGAYGVSKHALNALGEYIQRENQDLGIRVDTICPGMVVTPMVEGSTGLNHDKCLYPEDIAELVMWLLTRRTNIKIGLPLLIQTMENPWE